MYISITDYVEQDIHIEIEEGGFSYYGDYTLAHDITLEVEAGNLLAQLSDEEVGALRSELGVKSSVLSVDEVYDAMDDGDKARMFNKLLKHGKYNPNGTSIIKLVTAAQKCAIAQDKEV